MEGPPLESHALGSFSVWGPEAFQRSFSPSQRRVGQQTLPQIFQGPQLNPDPQASEQRSPLVSGDIQKQGLEGPWRSSGQSNFPISFYR